MIKLQELQKLPTIVTSVTQSVRAKDEIKSQAQTTLTKKRWFKMSLWCLQISQKTNEIFSRISVLASKKR